VTLNVKRDVWSVVERLALQREWARDAVLVRLALDVPVEFGDECFEVYFVNGGTVFQFFEIGDLAAVTVKTVALEYGDGLGIASEYLSDGHLFGDHTTSRV